MGVAIKFGFKGLLNFQENFRPRRNMQFITCSENKTDIFFHL